MDPKRLQNANALSAGSDLWLLPDLANSAWAQKIDWHVNFQLSKARRHMFPRHSPEMISLIQTVQTEMYNFEISPSAPLLVSTQNLLPNRYLMMLPFHGPLLKWQEKAAKIWQDLDRPSLRIFFPDSVTQNVFSGLQKFFAEKNTQLTYLSDEA